MGPRSRTEEAMGVPVAPEKLSSLLEVGAGDRWLLSQFQLLLKQIGKKKT